MTPDRIWALVDLATGEVNNVTLWDGVAEWQPPEGLTCIEVTNLERIPTPEWTYVDGEFIPPVIPQEPSAEEYTVSKLVLLERLAAVNLFEAAFQALGGPGSLMYEKWQAASYIDPNNQEVRQMLTAIGGDVDTLLAP